MKSGKVSESILKRSVLKTIKYKNCDILSGSAVGNDGAITESKMVIASAVAGLMFSEKNLYFDCKRAIYCALNNVAAEGGNPTGIIVDLILPEKRLESELKELMRFISAVCLEAKVQIAGGNTEVSRSVNSTVVTFSAFGNYMYDKHCNMRDIVCENDCIVMSKQIALSGTSAIAYENYDELSEKFQVSYIKKAINMENCMDVRREAEIARDMNVKVMHDLSRGGIYLGLWQLAEKTNRGVEAWLDKVDIKQETIELCEPYGINPYKLMSNGALLMVTDNGKKLVEELRNQGIDAEVIGRLTADNDKVFLKNEDRRYIEPPKRDEIEIYLSNKI